MNSDIMKMSVMAYVNQWTPTIVVDEVSYANGISDILVMRDGYICDIEIKISISDLKADMKKMKWNPSRVRKNGVLEYRRLNLDVEWSHAPNYFYIAIPEALEEKALPIIKKHWPYAGVLVVRNKRYRYLMSEQYVHDVVSAKRVKKIHDKLPSAIVVDKLWRNLSQKYIYKTLRYFDVKNPQRELL